MSDHAEAPEHQPAEPIRDTDAPDPATTRRARPDLKALLRSEWRLAVAVVTLVVGIVLVILGWYGAAYTNILSEQIPYLISGGLLGLGLIIVAGIMAASASQRRDSDELRRDLTRAIRALEAASAAGDAADPSLIRDAAPSTNGHAVFVLPGGRSFHEAGCPIIEGKPKVDSLARTTAASTGYAPCKLCELE